MTKEYGTHRSTNLSNRWKKHFKETQSLATTITHIYLFMDPSPTFKAVTFTDFARSSENEVTE